MNHFVIGLVLTTFTAKTYHRVTVPGSVLQFGPILATT